MLLQAKVKGNEGEYVATVGLENYYIQYDVMVGAYNDMGDGPNSTVYTVYSAEGRVYFVLSLTLFKRSILENAIRGGLDNVCLDSNVFHSVQNSLKKQLNPLVHLLLIVGAYNDMGDGPNSTVYTVYSAEGRVYFVSSFTLFKRSILENAIRGGLDNVCLDSNVFHSVQTSLKKQLNPLVHLLLRWGSVLDFLRTPIDTCDFPRGSGPPVTLSGSAHVFYVLYNPFCINLAMTILTQILRLSLSPHTPYHTM